MLTINEKEVLVKGAVLAMLADTQAAHSIGDFKIGVGFSLRKCRNCLATKDTMSVRVSVSEEAGVKKQPLPYYIDGREYPALIESHCVILYRLVSVNHCIS